MDLDALCQTARALVMPGKGLLAADESPGTIGKRFDAVGVENTDANRRAWRELLLRTQEAMGRDISGVILHEETLFQEAAGGTPLVTLVAQSGAIAGVKVDQGAKPLPGFPGELATEGMDGLVGRLERYRARGARFAKWRAVINMDAELPTAAAIKANAHLLARYARACQAAGMVPIVEPEVLMDGDQDLDRCDEVTRIVLQQVFQQLFEQRVALEAMVLKPNMVVPGRMRADRPSPETVARRTVAALKATVPPAVAGVAFLSGGQDERSATANLDALNRLGDTPWPLTFSFGRALQASALAAWAQQPQETASARRAFAHRARMNALASRGQWSVEVEDAA